jgi:hypothetical protein
LDQESPFFLNGRSFMIVYHLCHTPEVPQQLAEGLSRSHSRHYVFQRWDDIQLLLLRLNSESPPQAQSTDYAVLVLDVDEDMLLPGPIPQRKIPAKLRSQDLQGLQARSYFLEVDLTQAYPGCQRQPWQLYPCALPPTGPKARADMAVPRLHQALLALCGARHRRGTGQVSDALSLSLDTADHAGRGRFEGGNRACGA